MEWAGLGAVECEVTFPEIITADKSQKLKDIAFAKVEGFISHERAANMAAKELNITEFDFEVEKRVIAEERKGQELSAPLSDPPGIAPPEATLDFLFDSPDTHSDAGLSGTERNEIKDQGHE
jgi:hypothetical protein